MISNIQKWFAKVRPERTVQDLNAQFGCHIEEFLEMLDTVALVDEKQSALAKDLDSVKALHRLADALKDGRCGVIVRDRAGLLDSICDQIVTGTGVGHCVGLDVAGAVTEVDASNWSKFDPFTGEPIRAPGGKILKGPNYVAPDLAHYLSLPQI